MLERPMMSKNERAVPGNYSSTVVIGTQDAKTGSVTNHVNDCITVVQCHFQTIFTGSQVQLRNVANKLLPASASR